MIISKYFSDIQFPRKKYILKNISELLEKKIVDTPELTLSVKMFSKTEQALNQQQPKVMSSRIKKRSTSGINFQHYRTKSSLKARFNIVSDKTKRQKQFYQKIKLVSEDRNYKNLIEKNIEQNYKSSTSLPQKLFSNQALSKNLNPKRGSIINLQINENKEKVVEYQKRSQSLNKHYLSSKSTIFSKQKQENKHFLKKGSSVHKQIVTNLLRNKLLKAKQEIDNPQDLQKYHSKQTIIQMIKLYKGNHLKVPLKNKINLIQSQSTKTQRLINGWEYKNDQTELKQS